MILAVWTMNEKSLSDGRKAKQFELFQVFANELRFVPIEAVLAVAAFTPATTKYHASSVRSFLLAINALVLRTVEINLSTGTGFEILVKALIMIGPWAAGAENEISSIPTYLTLLENVNRTSHVDS